MSALAASLRLRASSRACDDVDLLAASRHAGFGWLSPDGAGCVGIGVAARVAPEDAVDALAAITHDDDSGTPAAGPRALGALSYDGDTPTGLVLPTWLLARDAEGRGWITHLGTNLDERAEPEPFLTLAPDAPTSTRPSRPHLDVRSRRDRDQWRRAVDRILDAIAAGAIQKLVLAREVDVDADAPFDRHRIIEHLHAEQPTCFVYVDGNFVGASPELLVRRAGAIVTSKPVAGTGPARAPRRLTESVKDRHEHRLVVDAIVETLEPWCATLDVAREPAVATFGRLAHLSTPITGVLRDPIPSAVDLARRLHPTPAVGGSPTAPALALQRELEGFDRGRYAGPIGWVDARGDGEWVLALRGAELDGTHARLVAGAGIVAGSDPDAEWEETEAKLAPTLRALAGR